MRDLDVRLAARSGVTLFLLGVMLLTVANFFRHDQRVPALAALATAGLAVVAVLLWLDRAGRATLMHAYVADLVGIVLVAGLVSQTGGAHSLYAPYYLFPVAHAAVFQPRRRFVIAAIMALIALAAPLVYDQWSSHFVTVALIALPPGAVLITITNAIVEALRAERRHLSRRETEALRIADADGLTGIGNYRMFWRALESEAARARRHDEMFSLIVLDLDGFKAINDELGHQAGDDALRRVASALRAQLRAEDVLCRQGGDEFAVIAVHAAGTEARDLADRLTGAVARDAARGLPMPLSATAGWATFGEPQRTAEGLLSQADRVLRDFKRRRASSWAPPAAPGGDGEPPVPSDPRLAVLSACARALAFADDERAVVQVAAAHVAEALDAVTVEIWRRDAIGGQPVLLAHANRTGAGAHAPLSAAGPSTAELVAVIRENRLADYPAGDGRCDLVVPISHAGTAIGGLVVRSAESGDRLQARRLALALGAQIGWALTAASAREGLAGADIDRVADEARRISGAAGEKVADLAAATATTLGFPAADVHSLRTAGLLHDVGMVGVPAGLRLRPFPLSEEETRVVREHPLIAERLLRPIPRVGEAAWILRHAQERFDGNGYPDGLLGESIPLASRVLAAAIAYVAMTSGRSYRPAMTGEQARTELLDVAGSQLDPGVVEALLEVLTGRTGAAVA